MLAEEYASSISSPFFNWIDSGLATAYVDMTSLINGMEAGPGRSMDFATRSNKSRSLHDILILACHLRTSWKLHQSRS